MLKKTYHSLFISPKCLQYPADKIPFRYFTFFGNTRLLHSRRPNCTSAHTHFTTVAAMEPTTFQQSSLYISKCPFTRTHTHYTHASAAGPMHMVREHSRTNRIYGHDVLLQHDNQIVIEGACCCCAWRCFALLAVRGIPVGSLIFVFLFFRILLVLCFGRPRVAPWRVEAPLIEYASTTSCTHTLEVSMHFSGRRGT